MIERAHKQLNIDLTAFKSPEPTTTTASSALTGSHTIEEDSIKIIDLDLTYRGTQLQRELFSTTKDKNLPKIFVDGRYIANIDFF